MRARQLTKIRKAKEAKIDNNSLQYIYMWVGR